MEDKKIAVLFESPGGTQEQYDASTKKLKEAGVVTVKGLLYHIAGPTENGWCVVEVWKSQEDMDAYSRDHIGKVLQEVGVPKPEMHQFSVYNITVGGEI